MSVSRPDSIGLSRSLRAAMTDAEGAIWYRIRNRQLGGYKFRRQQYIGPYIVDFACMDRHLVVEIDGGQHNDRVKEDEERTAFLEHEGYRVLRFWNDQVLKETEAVLGEILRALGEDIQG